MIRSMHPPANRVDHQRQFVGIGGFQLRQTTVFQDHFRQRIIQRQLGQHFLIGRRSTARGLFQHRQLLLFIQNGLQLLGRGQIERLFCQFMGLHFKLAEALGQLNGVSSQNVRIDQHPGAFDMGKHRQQRHFNLIEYRQQAFTLFQLRPHRQMQP